jgi:hypothetical protein
MFSGSRWHSMASKRVEDYAAKYGLSNSQAKRRIGSGEGKTVIVNVVRGGPVAGTGKKGKASKGKKA